MLLDAWIVLKKDLLIEMRTRVVMVQVLPIAGAILIIFGFALGPDNQTLQKAAPGLIWIAIILSCLIAVERSLSIEYPLGRDGLRLLNLDPAGLFLGKALAISIEMIGISFLVVFGSVTLYGSRFNHFTGLLMVVLTCILGSLALSFIGALYGAMSLGSQIRETLVPLLFLPVAAPVLLASTEITAKYLGMTTGSSLKWLGVLIALTISYFAIGFVGFEPLLEER